MAKSENAAAAAAAEPLLGFLVRDVLRLMQLHFKARAAELGLELTPTLFRVLFRLHRYPGCRQVELAETLEVTPVTVGRMLDRLEKQQLVRRAMHSDDRRAIRVFLGSRGTELMAQLQVIAHRTEDEALAGLSAAERDALKHALEQMRRNLSFVEANTRRGRGSGR